MPTFLLLSLALAAQDQSARTDQAPTPDAAADARAGEVIVTATRQPLSADRVVPSVTVLDKADIDRNQDIGVTELLLRTPGVSVSRNGGYGTNTSLRIRGAEPGQTLYVIDGVKLADPSQTDGGYNLGNLLVGDASRIEVLRGPQSVLWGSQAIGGVVNIVTPTPVKPLEGSFDVEAGSRDTVSARAAVGGVAGPLTFRVGAQAFTTDGISVISPDFGGRETDGYTYQNVTARAEVRLAPTVSVDLRAFHTDARTELDSTTGDTSDFTTDHEFVGYAGLNAALFDGRFKNRVSYAFTAIKRDNYSPPRAQELTFDGLGREDQIEYQGSFAIAAGWDATFGVDHEHQRFRAVSPAASPATPSPVSGGSADLTGGYANLNATVMRGLTLSGGLREDDHSRYGAKTLGQAGAVWNLPTGTTLRASYGDGFKAPTLYELSSTYGNAALQPEQATGWEAGAEQRALGGALTVGGTYFERRSRDLIVFAGCPAKTTLPLCFQSNGVARFGYYDNVQRAYAHGVEAVAALKLGARLLVDGNYTYSPSQDRSPGAATYGLQLARRPVNAANASATYSFGGGVSAGAAVRWSGETWDNAAHTIRLAPYALVDLRGEVALNGRVALFGRIENLLDKDYETAYRYASLGRDVFFGLRGRF